jgi:hypothetical protein
MHIWVRRSFALVGGTGLILGLAVGTPTAAAATTRQVTTTADSGPGSLREAVTNATDGDTVTFAPGVTGTIALQSPLLIESNVTITGPGEGVLTIDGGNQVQDVVVAGSSGTATISDLTISHGKGTTGGAIKDESGRSLTLLRVAVTDSNASVDGGGIYVSGTQHLQVIESTVSGNSAPEGGGIYADLPPSGELIVQSSTISGNTVTSGQGAGIYAAGHPTTVAGSQRKGSASPHAVAPPKPPPPPTPLPTSVGAVIITTSTIAKNTAGGTNSALFLHQLDSVSALTSNTIALNAATGLSLDNPSGDHPTLAASIVAHNTADCAGAALTDQGYDIDSDGSCSFGAAGSHSHSNQINAALGTLRDNGGPTATIAISATGDPAHALVPAAFTAAGVSAALCTLPDQRGALPASVPCDAGAFQRERAPKISASLHSKSHKTRYGWYNAPVRVTFTCLAGATSIAVTCTHDVLLKHNGRNQRAMGKAHTPDGLSATTSVHGVNIDRTAPTIHGAKSGHTYSNTPTITCTDALSGIARCTIDRHKHGKRVDYSVTAVDKAGNGTASRGSYTLS